ncbi:hypothetical protein O6H91_20G071600 [Diphasiastrum complanatum]|uniref:Uncharacterized protein n=1 Tax=Diphasiastrum complanatum TaxID=34168 RepID=A0ACC2ARP6_DIPCM|nr:hypothetical protein O6H91_20G071600 [Diphasiastrum complanatum]
MEETSFSSDQHQQKSKDLDKLSIGFAPVDIHGKPMDPKKYYSTGGWTASLFIFGNEITERMAYFGLAVNFINYLAYSMHYKFSEAATIVTNFLGTVQILPLLGAFIADSYLGRYWTIVIFSLIYLLGLVLLTISGIVPALRPSNAGCNQIKLFTVGCERPSTLQAAYLFTAIYVIALGTGGIRPCVSPFGADQFDVALTREKNLLGRFFNGFYFFLTVGISFSLVVIVYVQENFGWGWGFGAMAMAVALSITLYVAGTPLYRHRLPSGSPLTRVAQVIVAATRKINATLPEDTAKLYEVYDKPSAIKGSRKLAHTNFFRFLDKAAVITAWDDVEDNYINPWHLCTVTQVEEVKTLVKLIPVWLVCFIPQTVTQTLVNFTVQQGNTMNRKIGPHFTVPSATIPVISAIFVLMLLPIYDVILVPLIRRVTHKPRGISFLQRMGIGLIATTMAAIVAALFERHRRHVAWAPHVATNPQHIVPISAFWLSMQYLLLGVAEVFFLVGQLEFFYSQAPDGLRSIGTSYVYTADSIGNFIASLVVKVVQRKTGHHGSTPWLAQNINLGHLDRFYWLLSAMSLGNFLIFLVVAYFYRYKKSYVDPKKETTVETIDW